MIPRLGLGHDNPVDMCIVIADDFQETLQEQPFKEWPTDFADVKTSTSDKNHYWIQKSEDGHAATIHYHSRLDQIMTTLPLHGDKKAKPGQTTTYRATRLSEGYGGRPFPIKIVASGASLMHNVDDLGYELVVLRGPWHGIAPAPYVEVTYRTQEEHIKDSMWYFGLSISEEAYMAALRKYCPDWTYQTFYPIKTLSKSTPFLCHPATTLKPGILPSDLTFLDPNEKKIELCHKNLLCPKVAWPRAPHKSNPAFMGEHDQELLTELGVMENSYDLALITRNKLLNERWQKESARRRAEETARKQALIDQGIDPDADEEEDSSDYDGGDYLE